MYSILYCDVYSVLSLFIGGQIKVSTVYVYICYFYILVVCFSFFDVSLFFKIYIFVPFLSKRYVKVQDQQDDVTASNQLKPQFDM